MRLKPGQGLGKWNQGIAEQITIQTRLHRQGLGYQEKKTKIGQDTLAKKWSISKKVTRAHINMINFDWSEITDNEPKPKSIEDSDVDKLVQHLTRSGRAYQPQEARAKETGKAPAQSEESRVVEQLKKTQAQIFMWGLLVSSKPHSGIKKDPSSNLYVGPAQISSLLQWH